MLLDDVDMAQEAIEESLRNLKLDTDSAQKTTGASGSTPKAGQNTPQKRYTTLDSFVNAPPNQTSPVIKKLFADASSVDDDKKMAAVPDHALLRTGRVSCFCLEIC